MLLTPQNKFDLRNQGLMSLGAGLLSVGAPRVGSPGPGIGPALQQALTTTNQMRGQMIGNNVAQARLKDQQADRQMKLRQQKAVFARQEAANKFFNPVSGANGPTRQSAQTPLQKAFPNATPDQLSQAAAIFNATGDTKAALAVLRPQKPVSVPAGGTLVNPVTGATVATGVPKQTPAMLNAQAAGHKPGSSGYQKFIAQTATKAPPGTKQVFDVFSNSPAFATEAQIQQNPDRYQPIPRGMKLTSDGQGGFTMVSGTMAGSSSLQKPVATDLQKRIVGLDDHLARFDRMTDLYKPEYLTYRGEAKAGLANFLNRMDPEQRSQFAAQRTAFVQQVRQYQNEYRKLITGVAAGPQEMKMLQKSNVNDKMSPQEFEAALKEQRSWTRRLKVRYQRYLKEGVTTPFKKWAKSVPIQSIKSLNDRGNELMREFGDKAFVKQKLREEGYI